MSDISKIKLPNGDVYNLKDSEALHRGDATTGAIQGITKQGGQIVTIADAANNYPLQSLKVSFGPYQEGSGDPSPENVRPISGWDGLSVFVSPTTTGGTEYPITWQSAGTVYGGTLDVVKGILTVDYKAIILNANTPCTQFYISSNGLYTIWSGITDMASGTFATDNKVMLDRIIKVANRVNVPNTTLAALVGYNNNNIYLYNMDNALGYTTTEQISNWLAQNPITCTIKLATPLTYQLAPQIIKTILGENHIWSNVGIISSITYAKDTKAFIQQNTVKDVQLNNTSVVNNGIANIPKASSTDFGVVKTSIYGVDDHADGGIFSLNDKLIVIGSNFSKIKAGADLAAPVSAGNQHVAAFYGLAKAAGDTTQSQSNNAVGTYTDEARSAIQTMLDVPSNDDIPSVPVQDVQINGTSILNNGIANIPQGNATDHGVFLLATSNDIKAGTSTSRVITPAGQNTSAFYGLAKAAGVDMASSYNSVGQYTEEAKKAIREMLGIPNFDSEIIYDGTTTEDLDSVVVSTDNNGLPFELRAFKVFVKLAASTTGTNDFITCRAMMKDVEGTAFYHTLPTMRMINSSGSLHCYEFEAFPGGLYFNRGYSSSNFGSTSGSQSSMPMDKLVKSATSINVRQYNASSTLVPSGTRIVIIGIRI